MSQVIDKNEFHPQDLISIAGISVPAQDWTATLRETAQERFLKVGFPTRKDEDWKYTNVAPIANTKFTITSGPGMVSPEQIEPFSLSEFNAIELVFVDGFYAPELSQAGVLPKGLTIGNIASKKSDKAADQLGKYADISLNPFVALNTALFGDGAFIHVERGAVIENTIHLLFVSTASDQAIVAQPRNLVVVDENAQVTIVESYIGVNSGVTLNNVVSEFICAQNSIVDHYKVQRENRSSFHVTTQQIQLERSANFTSHSFNMGGALVRNDINAELNDEGIECTLNGLYFANSGQLVDNHTSIDHAMPHCNSHELYKGIIDGNGRGVFNGKIFVKQDAQKTDAKQTNQTLLLSDEAQINTKPQLEIYADDVKCTHGATVGQLSDEALFYMRSRGIGQEEARNLLIYAFASDIVSRIKVEPVRDQLNHILLSERSIEGIA